MCKWIIIVISISASLLLLAEKRNTEKWRLRTTEAVRQEYQCKASLALQNSLVASYEAKENSARKEYEQQEDLICYLASQKEAEILKLEGLKCEEVLEELRLLQQEFSR